MAESSFTYQTKNHGINRHNKWDILLLHDDADNWDEEGHGAGILSFRSQMKLIPDDLSSVASEGKLGRRHPDSIPEKDGRKWTRK